MIIRDANFRRPHSFDEKLGEIKRKIAQLKAKAQHLAHISGNGRTGQ